MPLSMSLLPFERRTFQHLSRSNAPPLTPYSTPDIPSLLENGIIPINKPKGPTSHQVAAWTKEILGISKAGQGGTLDPSVTGVLPVAINRATNLMQVLLTAGKEYLCWMHLHGDFTPQKITHVCNSFVGKIRQLPPLKSAVKRQWRYRKIYYFDILEIQQREVLCRIGCQAGTYIRKLCSDIGDKLGCGAHMAQLIRTKSGSFAWHESISLQDLTDAWHAYKQGNSSLLSKYIAPIEHMTKHLPKIYIQDIQPFSKGVQLRSSMIMHLDNDIQAEEYAAIYSLDQRLIGIVTTLVPAKEMLHAKRQVAKTLRIVTRLPH